MMGSLADDMTDDDIRRALVRLAAEYHADEPPQEVAAGIRRFAAAAERLQRP